MDDSVPHKTLSEKVRPLGTGVAHIRVCRT